jgi:hypothetical protein
VRILKSNKIHNDDDVFGKGGSLDIQIHTQHDENDEVISLISLSIVVPPCSCEAFSGSWMRKGEGERRWRTFVWLLNI